MSDSIPEAKDADPRFVIRGLLYEGGITLLVGRNEEEASDFALRMIASIEAGEPVMGQPTSPSNVIFALDKVFDSLLERARSYGVTRSTFLTGHFAEPPIWPYLLVESAILEAPKLGARVLVIDTQTLVEELAHDVPDDVFKTCREAANKGFAVLLLAAASPWHKNYEGSKEVMCAGVVDRLILIEDSSRSGPDWVFPEVLEIRAFAPAPQGPVLLGLDGRAVWPQMDLTDSPGSVGGSA